MNRGLVELQDGTLELVSRFSYADSWRYVVAYNLLDELKVAKRWHHKEYQLPSNWIQLPSNWILV